MLKLFLFLLFGKKTSNVDFNASHFVCKKQKKYIGYNYCPFGSNGNVKLIGYIERFMSK